MKRNEHMNKLKLSIHSSIDTDIPSFLTVTITPSLKKRIKQLARECKRLNVLYISEFNYSPTWGSKNDHDFDGSAWNIDCCILVVSDRDFYWTGMIRHSSIALESKAYNICDL